MKPRMPGMSLLLPLEGQMWPTQPEGLFLAPFSSLELPLAQRPQELVLHPRPGNRRRWWPSHCA